MLAIVSLRNNISILVSIWSTASPSAKLTEQAIFVEIENVFVATVGWAVNILACGVLWFGWLFSPGRVESPLDLLFGHEDPLFAVVDCTHHI